MTYNVFLDQLSALILAHKHSDAPLLVGINGVDGSGKTHLARRLCAHFKAQNQDVLRISIDDFHNPKHVRYQKGETSPVGFYEDSINYSTFINGALKPIYNAKNFPATCQTKAFDLETDRPSIHTAQITQDTIIITEGIFLFRPEIAPYLACKIFVDVNESVTLKRMKIRDVCDQQNDDDLAAYEQRCLTKYRPGQKLYFDHVQPKYVSDIILDNNDYDSPKIIKPTCFMK